MARKPNTITHLMDGTKANPRDERALFKCLWRTGVIHKKDRQQHFPEISSKRLKIMFRDGWLKKEGKYIYLGKKGEDYLRNNMKMEYKYRANETHIRHDLKLNRMYLRLSEKQRETWKTETQIRHEISSEPKYHDMYNHPKWGNPYDPHIRKNFIPDATVYSESFAREIVLEAVTEYYSNTDIDMKMETAAQFYDGHIYTF